MCELEIKGDIKKLSLKPNGGDVVVVQMHEDTIITAEDIEVLRDVVRHHLGKSGIKNEVMIMCGCELMIAEKEEN